MTSDEQHLLEEKYGGVPSAEFEADCARLAAGEPLAYVIGTQPFLGLTIHLDSHPLIPRPETEWWTEKLLNKTGEASSVVRLGQAARSVAEDASPIEHPVQFLDLCAGSGAIGCAVLAKLPNAQVIFSEIDPEHKATIEKNIRENKLDASRADIRIGDLFAPFSENETFDYIAVNPPYIPNNRELDKSVTDYEPAEALFSGSDGLDIIRRLAKELPKHLAPSGKAFIEIDASHAEQAKALFEAAGMRAELYTDPYDRPRLLVVSFP